MIVAIIGSRCITGRKGYEAICYAVRRSGFPIKKIISGGAKGIDSLAEVYARNKGIPFQEFPANWKQLGRRAGIKRNEDMSFECDAVIAIWDGKSKGTKHMIDFNLARSKKVFIHIAEPEEDEETIVHREYKGL